MKVLINKLELSVMAYDNKLKDGIGFGAIISINSQDYLDVLN
jgi:hypothetical protein